MSYKPYSNKLMIVAHPDDESIFGGGLLVSEPGWKVICLTNGSNETRCREFVQAMEFIGADYEIWDYPDVYDGSFDEESVKADLSEVLDSGRYELIVTHNLDGEYGHSQHKALSQIVHSMDLDNLYVFDTSDQRLPEDVLKKKKLLLDYYQSQMYVIDGLGSYIIYEQIRRVTE